MAGESMISVRDSDNFTLISDDATFVTNSESVRVVDVRNCRGSAISSRNALVVAGASKGADVVIANVADSTDTTVDQDGTTVVGNVRNATMARVERSNGTDISQRYVTLLSATGDRLPRGTLNVNEIRESHGARIDQTGSMISGEFSDVRVNEISNSTNLEIVQDGMEINVNDSSDNNRQSDFSGESDDEQREVIVRTSGPPTVDNWQGSGVNPDENSLKQLTERESCESSTKSVPAVQTTVSAKPNEVVDKCDKDGLPKRNTREYALAEKFTFNVKLLGGGSITMRRLRQDRVRNVIAFIKEKHRPSRNKSFRLQVDEEAGKILGENLEDTLAEAGFADDMELRMAETS